METLNKLRPIFYIGFSAAIIFVAGVFIISTLILFNQVEELRTQTIINQNEIHFNNERLDSMMIMDSVKIKILSDNNRLLQIFINDAANTKK